MKTDEFMMSILTEEEREMLSRSEKWKKVVLDLWREERSGEPKKLTEYEYYYDLLTNGIITLSEWNNLVENIKE